MPFPDGFLAQTFLKEFEHEAKTTAKFLERFDDKQADFRPHDKSFTASRLASHVVEGPGWAYSILGEDVFDFDAVDYTPPDWRTSADLLENHERIIKMFVEAMTGKSDAHLMETWCLKQGGHTLMELPRAAAIRSMVINHLIHHRAQLSVYYRMMGIPVPGAYGPSADEGRPGS